ncbi:hypothetical protein [Kluyvera intermedia]|uniref:hypothetical protein n=1 Tax=Kluyvera intermedia TaxID=61648 RepID=UPI0035260FE9
MSDVEITGNESLEELESKLALIENAEDVDVTDPVPAVTAPVTQIQTPAVTTRTTPLTGDNADPSTSVAGTEQSAAGGAPATPPPGGEVKGAVLAEDGVHTIPYEVLEAARERAPTAEQRIQELSVDVAMVKDLEQQIQSLKQRAVDAGADESLLSGDGLTEEQLSDLAEASSACSDSENQRNQYTGSSA